ncbi:MAG: hypothetical protein MH472_04885 [Bacteroidia bacterium]|nr:hypothetical protein [Bacteroidia bacterium]
MKKLFFLPAFFLLALVGSAQELPVMEVPLTQYAKDDRFDKYQITLALFRVKGDTIWSLDFEGTKPSKPIKIKTAGKHREYAYGNLFFSGSKNSYNPGYVSVLVGDPYNKNPKLYVDHNQNFDFSDDTSYRLPYFDEPALELELINSANPDGRIKILLSRSRAHGQKYEFRRYMDEYYAMAYPGREFMGYEFCYREQRYIARSGMVKLGRESFKIALLDVNANGIYNDAETDKVLFVNLGDSILDATNPLNFVVFSKPGKPNYFEKNDKLYQIVEVDPAGKFVKIKESKDAVEFNRIKIGKKVPKVKLTPAKGNPFKISKLRRKEIYIYFGNRSSKNFHSDTLILRQIAQLNPEKLKVICVLYVNKSYELRIFNSDADPNYYLVYGTKELSTKLGINSLPQYLYLGKRRKVKQYGLNPNEFLRMYLEKKK